MAKVKNRSDDAISERMTATDTLNLNPAFISHVKKEETSQQALMAQKLRSDMQRMREDELFPDMQFLCGEQSFPGHKMVIRCRLQNSVDSNWYSHMTGALPTLHLAHKTQEDGQKFLKELYTLDDISSEFVTEGLKLQNQPSPHKGSEEEESDSQPPDPGEKSHEPEGNQNSENVSSSLPTQLKIEQQQDFIGLNLADGGNLCKSSKNGPMVNAAELRYKEGSGDGADVEISLAQTVHDEPSPQTPVAESSLADHHPVEINHEESGVPSLSSDTDHERLASKTEGHVAEGGCNLQPCAASVGNEEQSAIHMGSAITGEMENSKDVIQDDLLNKKSDHPKELDGSVERSHQQQDAKETLKSEENLDMTANSNPEQSSAITTNALDTATNADKVTETSKSLDKENSISVNGLSEEKTTTHEPSIALENADGPEKQGDGGNGVPEDIVYIPCSSLASALLKCYQSEEYADCCLKVEGRKFMAHRCILAARCQYFDAMFAGSWCESEEMEIELHGVKAQSVRYIVLFLYGAMLEVPASDITFLMQAVDMLGVEGLKDWLGFLITRDFCHFFHKPCQDCMRMVPDVLVLASQFNLTSVLDRSKRWVSKHFRRIWELQHFGALPQPLLDECTKAVTEQMSVQNITQVILDAHVLARCLQQNHRSEHVQLAAIRIMDEALAYCAGRFSTLVKSPYFLSWSKDGAWCIDVLEESYTMVVSLLRPEQACQVYSSLRQLQARSEAEDSGLYASEEVRQLLRKLVERCEWYLNRYIHRVVQCPYWEQLPADLQQQLLQKSSFVPVHAASAVGAQSRVAQKSAQVLRDNIVHTVTMLCETNPSLFPSLSQTRKILYNNTKKSSPRAAESKRGVASKTTTNSSQKTNAKSQAGSKTGQRGKTMPPSRKGTSQGKNAASSSDSRPSSGKSSGPQNRSSASASANTGARPKTSAAVPNSGTSRPVSGKTSVTKSQQNGASTSSASRTSRQQPGTAVKQEADASVPSVSGVSRPASGASKVASGTSRPSSGRSTKSQEKESVPSASQTSRPASGASKPALSTSRPASGTSRPGSGASRPASGTSKPASSTARPSSGTSRPASSTARPASGTSRPSPGRSTKLQEKPSAPSTSGASRPTSGRTNKVPDKSTSSSVSQTAKRPLSATTSQTGSKPTSSGGNASGLKASSSKESSPSVSRPTAGTAKGKQESTPKSSAQAKDARVKTSSSTAASPRSTSSTKSSKGPTKTPSVPAKPGSVQTKGTRSPSSGHEKASASAAARKTPAKHPPTQSARVDGRQELESPSPSSVKECPSGLSAQGADSDTEKSSRPELSSEQTGTSPPQQKSTAADLCSGEEPMKRISCESKAVETNMVGLNQEPVEEVSCEPCSSELSVINKLEDKDLTMMTTSDVRESGPETPESETALDKNSSLIESRSEEQENKDSCCGVSETKDTSASCQGENIQIDNSRRAETLVTECEKPHFAENVSANDDFSAVTNTIQNDEVLKKEVKAPLSVSMVDAEQSPDQDGSLLDTECCQESEALLGNEQKSGPDTGMKEESVALGFGENVSLPISTIHAEQGPHEENAELKGESEVPALKEQEIPERASVAQENMVESDSKGSGDRVSTYVLLTQDDNDTLCTNAEETMEQASSVESGDHQLASEKDDNRQASQSQQQDDILSQGGEDLLSTGVTSREQHALSDCVSDEEESAKSLQGNALARNTED